MSRLSDLDNVTTICASAKKTLDRSEIADAVRAALRNPIGYPPLAEATVPGDRVVVPLSSDIPCCEQVVEGLLAALRESGIDDSHVTLMWPNESASLSGNAFGATVVEIHDPTDESNCAMIGVTQAGYPLRMNRKLSEADIVLPVGVAVAPSNADEYEGPFRAIFPQFCDQETIDRHSRNLSGRKKSQQMKDRNKIYESGWLLGVGIEVAVVPGPQGTIANVLAGAPDVVAREGVKRYRKIWQREVSSSADLAILILHGEAGEHSWRNIGQALAAAETVIKPGGAVAIDSQLAEPPGRSLARLAKNTDYARVEQQILNDSYTDSWVALQVCRALDRGPVYLRSQLADEVVESFAVAPISSDDELVRLVESHQHCVVLEDAHRLNLDSNDASTQMSHINSASN